MATDVHWSEVKLLLHAHKYGIHDVSVAGQKVTLVGNASVALDAPFGGNWSIDLGTGASGVRVEESPSLLFGTGKWCIDGWIKLTEYPPNYGIVYGRNEYGESGDYALYVTPTGKLLSWCIGVSTGVESTESLPVGEWERFSAQRGDDDQWSVYVGGHAPDTLDISASATSTGAGYYNIGGDHNFDEVKLLARLFNLRVTVGAARHGSSPIPTTPFEMASQVKGRVYDQTGAPAARSVRLHDAVGGASVSDVTQSDSVDGTYTCNAWVDSAALCERVVETDDPTQHNNLIDLVYTG